MGKEYWNESFETLSRAETERLESNGLQRQMRYLYQTSAFYAQRFDEADVRPDSIRHREDLVKIPLMEKAELADSQRHGELIGANQCAPLSDIVRIQATGGTTTGRPLRVGYTKRDAADFAEMGARSLWAMGCRPTDIVFECMNYNLYVGGVSDHMAFEAMGASTIPFGVGNSRRLLEMIDHLTDDVALWSTPSYALRLAELCRLDSLPSRSLGLRKGFFTGEPGLEIPDYRERIESIWGMRAMNQYGTGELGVHSGECEYQNGFHYMAADCVLAELIDPDTRETIGFEDGAKGEFVFTSIKREASPLLRMRSHDIVQVFTDPCSCGRTSFRFLVLGRTDDMFIVKGVNVFPQDVQTVISQLQPRLTGEIQILLDKAPPIDYSPTIRVEVAHDVPHANHPDLIKEAEKAIAQRLNFSAEVQLVPQGTIATEKKTRRLYRTYKGDVPDQRQSAD